MTAVLVTGGAGYAGSHSCKALAGAGFIPVTYDNLSRGHRHAAGIFPAPPPFFPARFVNWLTYARTIPRHAVVHRKAKADFNFRGWQGR